MTRATTCNGGSTVPSRMNAGAFILLCWLASSALSQPTSPAPQEPPNANAPSMSDGRAAGGADDPVGDLEARLTEARTKLASPAGDATLLDAPVGVSPGDLWVRRAALNRIVRILEQQASNVAELETARVRKAEAEREALAWTRFMEPVPYSILLTDRLREDLQAERLSISTAEASAATLQQILDEQHALLADAEEKTRQLNEQIEGAHDPTVAARLTWQRELEHLRSQTAAGTVAIVDLERQIGQERAATSRIRLGLLERQLVIADAGARFTQADLDQALTQVERAREQLERELSEARARHDAAVEALELARAELRATSESADAPTEARERATELVSVREAALEASDATTRALRLMLEGSNLERALWGSRFATYDSRSLDALSDGRYKLGSVTRRLELWRDHARQQLEVSSSRVQLEQARLNGLALDSALLPLARERLAALSEQDQFLLRVSRTAERLERLTQRVDEGLRAAEGKLPLMGRIRAHFAGARSLLQRLWTLELFVAEDTITVDGQKITGRRSVTIGKIVMAALILVGGVWITWMILRVVELLAVRRFKIDVNQAGLLRRWLRVALVACLVVVSFVSVKIPLTVFAFAGGALAIGLGFGTQTMLKNFASGLIILFERPFRVGDLLDIGGLRGTVTSIGLRASVLKAWDGTESLIPNSTLLEGNLTNWTYSDSKVRFAVTVGVAYGTDTRLVMRLLGEVMERHGLVLREPAATTLFTEFGDSTLNFELRFWVDVSIANAALVSSDLRMMIAGAFADNGIVIDFPQRDIHLHADQPIPVVVVAGAGSGSA